MSALPTRHGFAAAAFTVSLGLSAPALHAQLDFGDDSSEWARDGECDDPRFEGKGSAETLLDADAYHDATDCRTLLGQGRISVRTAGTKTDMQRGRLEKGDATLSSGENSDGYTFTVDRGQRAVVDQRSRECDR